MHAPGVLLHGGMALLAACVFVSPAAAQTIYRWVTSNGTVVYSQVPPPGYIPAPQPNPNLIVPVLPPGSEPGRIPSAPRDRYAPHIANAASPANAPAGETAPSARESTPATRSLASSFRSVALSPRSEVAMAVAQATDALDAAEAQLARARGRTYKKGRDRIGFSRETPELAQLKQQVVEARDNYAKALRRQSTVLASLITQRDALAQREQAEQAAESARRVAFGPSLFRWLQGPSY